MEFSILRCPVNTNRPLPKSMLDNEVLSFVLQKHVFDIEWKEEGKKGRREGVSEGLRE